MYLNLDKYLWEDINKTTDESLINVTSRVCFSSVYIYIFVCNIFYAKYVSFLYNNIIFFVWAYLLG